LYESCQAHPSLATLVAQAPDAISISRPVVAGVRVMPTPDITLVVDAVPVGAAVVAVADADRAQPVPVVSTLAPSVHTGCEPVRPLAVSEVAEAAPRVGVVITQPVVRQRLPEPLTVAVVIAVGLENLA